MPPRSPAIFWLLLAATLAVDAVAIYWVNQEFNPSSAVLYNALAFAQLSILSVWAILLPPKVQLRWLVPFVAGAIVALLLMTTRELGPQPGTLLIVTVVMWGHVIICTCVLWLLKPTRLLADWIDPTTTQKWQFGTAHLLMLMTLLAVVSISVKQAYALLSAPAFTATLFAGNAMLLIAILVSRSKIAHWPFRLVVSFGAALLIAVVCQSLPLKSPGFDFYVFFLVQAAMIWAWAEILLPAQPATVAAAERSMPEAAQ